MLCAACRAVYAASLAACPLCRTPARAKVAGQTYRRIIMTPSARQEQTHTNADDNAANAPPPTPAASTLLEFPLPGRAPKPQWRKELGERVREIQQRKAQEAARENGADAQATGTAATPTPDAPVSPAQAAPATNTAQPLGLVPPAPAAEVNPLVVAALKRIERARQPPIPQPRMSGRGRGATAAVARVAREDEYQVAVAEPQPTVAPVEQPLIIGQTTTDAPPQNEEITNAPAATPLEATAQVGTQVEPPRTVNLVVVPPPQTPAAQSAPAEVDVAARAKARRHIPVVLDDAYLARREAVADALNAPHAPQAADRAPLAKRLAAGFIDLLVVAFAATPFAAIIELTNGNWADPRVAGSLGGIIVVLLFLYLMASTALAGRTWGMSLVALRTVDAKTGHAPTTGQCVRRAFGYMLALATGGLGLLYALFDAKGRALHDHLSGTTTVRA